MKKERIPNRWKKLKIVDSFIHAMVERNSFLMAGHQSPDEDCVASMVAFCLLMGKFNKKQAMILSRENWDKFPYLLSICKYNSILVIGDPEVIQQGDFDTVVAFDTPKPSMLEFKKELDELTAQPLVTVMEIDHHLEADGEYIGQEGYRLVDEASSTCELIGYLAVRLTKKKSIIRQFGIWEIFSRNFVLAIVTGMVGDSKMGQFLKTRREKRYYRYFSRMFNKMLIEKTDKNSGNFSSIEDILTELEKLSVQEENCFRDLFDHRRQTGVISWIALDYEASRELLERYETDIIVTVVKYTANILADESGYLSLIAFYDDPERSDLIQLRMRRSHSYKELDLRSVIAHFGFTNGGGHEGAVGFRLPKSEVADFDSFIKNIIEGTLELID
ncbi:MAG: DHH family phosphoesterase [Spirochaetaceae bacterium]|nr:DHH family phosphoesterase [Spirochaetaceae bacterium]